MSRWRRRLATALGARFPFLLDRWLARHELQATEGVPWTPFDIELTRARVGLVTTAGVHLRTQPPFDMSTSDGDPSWRELPDDLPDEAFTITHDYYDIRAARADLNVVFPRERLRELQAAGRIGASVARHAGLMGHIEASLLETLTGTTAPAVAEHMRAQGADLVLLVPT